MSKKDGGPAYPTTQRIDEKYMDQGGYGRIRRVSVNVGGMTLRDHFAGQALAGILASPNTQEGGRELAEGVAQGAYLVADAMLKERGRG